MPDVALAQGLMRGFVESRPGSNLKHKLGSAATALHWTCGRAKAVFYGEARRIDAREMAALKRVAQQETIEELIDDRDELVARLARMEAMLALLVSGVAGAPLPSEGASLRKPRGSVGSRTDARNL